MVSLRDQIARFFVVSLGGQLGWGTEAEGRLGGGPSEEITLSIVRAVLHRPLPLGDGLNPFNDGLDSQGVVAL